jgi:hypothetical protein
MFQGRMEAVVSQGQNIGLTVALSAATLRWKILIVALLCAGTLRLRLAPKFALRSTRI